MLPGRSIIFSHATDEWETPDDIFQDLNSEFHFSIDVACTSKNAKCELKCATDLGINGLEVPWHRFGNAFCNPPHSAISRWVKKALDESKCGGFVVMLIPARIGTTWWHQFVLPNAVEIREVLHRINFKGMIKKPGQKDIPNDQAEYVLGTAPSTFDSAIVIFDGKRRSETSIVGPIRTTYIQPKDRNLGGRIDEQ